MSRDQVNRFTTVMTAESVSTDGLLIDQGPHEGKGIRVYKVVGEDDGKGQKRRSSIGYS